METRWLDQKELAAWIRLAALVELLPGVLEVQLRRDADLSHFEYFTLATLSEAADHTVRMSALASLTNATLPRLSHVVGRLEGRSLVERSTAPDDKRASDVRLTATGLAAVRDAAPEHVANVRAHVIDALTSEQIDQLTQITEAILRRLDPSGVMRATYSRYDISAQPARGDTD